MRRNPIRVLKRHGMFGSDATASARRVTKTPQQVIEKGTGNRGEVIAVLPGGWLKVQWHNRSKPTLIKRSELKRAQRANVEGYTDESGFHPIRASKDYNEFKTSDVDSPAEAKARKRKRATAQIADWNMDAQRRQAAQMKDLTTGHAHHRAKVRSLAQFVRAQGGMTPGGDLAGEVARLSYKETGTTGLINQHARQGSHKQTPEYVMDAAHTEGFGPFDSIGDFILAVEEDATGARKHYSNEDLNDMVDLTDNPSAQFGELTLIRIEHERPSGKGWAVYDKYDFGGRAIPESKLEDAAQLARNLGKRFNYQTRLYIKRAGKAATIAYQNPSATPYFCSICERELKPGQWEALKDGRTVCIACAKGIKRRSLDKKQRDMFTEQEQLFNPSDAVEKFGRDIVEKIYANRPRNAGPIPVVKQKKYKYCPGCQFAAISDEDGSRGTCLKCGRYSAPWEREAFYKAQMAQRGRRDNPGLIELAGGLQAADYLLGKIGRKRNAEKGARKRNASETSGDMGAGATSSDVRSPTRTSTEVRSPTKTSTVADTRGNITVTGGAGAGATTKVIVKQNAARKANPPQRYNVQWKDERGNWHEGARKFDSEAAALRYARQVEKEHPNWIVSVGPEEKRNPSPREMSERFQGAATGSVRQYYASNSAPRLDFSRAGRLTHLKVNGKSIPVAHAVAAIDPRTERIWIANARKGPLFNRKAKRQGEFLDYGEVDTIGYLTAKQHIGAGKTFDYRHNFGEEGGRKPRLLIDYEGMPILKGGDYRVKSEGIVN